MSWHAWSKWLVLGVVATAVVMFAPDDDGRGTVADNGNHHQLEQPATQAVMQRKQGLKPGQAAGRVELERLSRKQPAGDAAGVANAFIPTSWYVPPPSPPVLPAIPVPPPKPSAPPLPFRYFGRYDDPPAPRIVILAKGDQLYTVSEGDVIDESYRVEHIGEGAVSLVYLPLNINQSINTGGMQ